MVQDNHAPDGQDLHSYSTSCGSCDPGGGACGRGRSSASLGTVVPPGGAGKCSTALGCKGMPLLTGTGTEGRLLPGTTAGNPPGLVLMAAAGCGASPACGDSRDSLLGGDSLVHGESLVRGGSPLHGDSLLQWDFLLHGDALVRGGFPVRGGSKIGVAAEVAGSSVKYLSTAGYDTHNHCWLPR